MSQWLQYVFFGDAFQIPAGLTQSGAATDNLTDAEPLADEMVECSVLGDNISAVFPRREFDIRLALDPFDGFPLDER